MLLFFSVKEHKIFIFLAIIIQNNFFLEIILITIIFHKEMPPKFSNCFTTVLIEESHAEEVQESL
jgi:hypothetical protein